VSVHISELEVVPRGPSDKEQQQKAEPPPQQQAPSPELAHEIARTAALLRSRDLRLKAD
jgi:hypothetical protein